MGIYPRLAAAFLALFVLSSEAAKRQTVNHGQTARSMINGQSATTGSVSTPAGAAAFFGQEYTSYHTPGERFNGGDSVPNSGSGSGSTAKQPVNVKPGNFFNKARAAAMAKNAIKGGVAGVVATAAVAWAADQIGGMITDGQLVKPIPDAKPQTFVYYVTTTWTGQSRYPSVITACTAAAESRGYINTNNAGGGFCSYKTASSSTIWSGAKYAIYNEACSTGYTSADGTTCLQNGGFSPFADTDFADFEAALASMNNNPWLQDLIKASCEGSLNPDGCYDSLVDNPFVIGPASQTGSPKSTTTTTTNPDGTTSTSTVTSTPSYSYTYGSNYYDYTTTTTTTTNNNGQVTTTVSTDTSEGTPEEDPASEEEKEEETDFSGEYTDAPFTEVTPFYEQKYPDGLQGVWDSASAQVSSSAFLQFLQSFVPSFSGTCPSWSLSFNIMPQAMFGTFEFMSLCYVFDFVKIILMATAVFCARWIMFGG